MGVSANQIMKFMLEEMLMSVCVINTTVFCACVTSTDDHDSNFCIVFIAWTGACI